MKRFGLIGHPIAHSLSPALFKAGFDGRYPYDLIETENFEEAYERFLRNYDGINVTAPFKESAARKAEILSEECRQIGAANILIKTPDGIKAYNSDYLGVRQWLCEVVEGLNIGPTILIVGLGGAGKAAAEAARSLGFRTILMNRTRFSDEIRPLEEFCRCFREADIIIYNIPTAIPQLAELTAEDFRGITAGNDTAMLEVCRKADTETAGACRPKVIIEANYKNPSFDKNMTDRMIAANPDARYVSGETWLLYQALTGYELFTGEKPDPIKMAEVISGSR